MKKRGFLLGRGRNYILLLVSILVVIIVLLIIQNLFLFKTVKKESSQAGNTHSEIIAKLSEHDIAAGETPTKITQLSGKTLQELKETQPAVYGDAEEGFFEVRYPNWFVIYDSENDQIVKKFRFQSIGITS